ncbi:MAG: DUF3105 domain-containing protein [Actinomycetota bacterium]
MSDKVSPGGHRPTKAERKEQARIEREQLQQKLASRKRTRALMIGVGAVALAAIVVAVVLTRPEEVDVPTARTLLAEAPAGAEQADCGQARNVGEFDPAAQDRTHVGGGGVAQMPPLSAYPSAPPASGPHNAVPLSAGVYDTPPPLDQVIHSLEHGGVAIWHSPDATGPELAKMTSFYGEEANGEKMIVAPYDYPDEGAAGQLPPGVEMSLVAWHYVQECESANLAASYGFVNDFRATQANAENYKGEAPEPLSSM